MKRFFTWPVTFEKVEFWAATCFYMFVLLLDLNMSSHFKPPHYYAFLKYGTHYSHTINFLLPAVLKYTTYYIGYVLLNFIIIRNIVYQRRMEFNFFLIALITFLLVIALTAFDAYLVRSYLFRLYKNPWVVYRFLVRENLIHVFMLSVSALSYTLIKYIILAVIKGVKPLSWRFPFKIGHVWRDCFVIVVLWFIGVVGSNEVNFYTVMMAVVLYLFVYNLLIPYIRTQKKGYAWYTLCTTLIIMAAFFVLFVLGFQLHNMLAMATAPYIWVAAFLIVHLAWLLYHYRLKNTKITGLETALGHSSANLDLLRSQINPHFLFNALNTLYGTALQEEASRTGEGIQKLGDMMRFMLHDNTQQIISLNREVEYLNNYISLQKLRTQTSPDIAIQTEIDEHFNDLHIVPMLLIPFVENAFKHGISLREASFIKITLHAVGNLLYFDVHNSIHTRTDNDPEKNNNGIGLENVRQRLNLLYPDRYELTIRETAKEFFIHLTIEL